MTFQILHRKYYDAIGDYSSSNTGATAAADGRGGGGGSSYTATTTTGTAGTTTTTAAANGGNTAASLLRRLRQDTEAVNSLKNGGGGSRAAMLLLDDADVSVFRFFILTYRSESQQKWQVFRIFFTEFYNFNRKTVICKKLPNSTENTANKILYTPSLKADDDAIDNASSIRHQRSIFKFE